MREETRAAQREERKSTAPREHVGGWTEERITILRSMWDEGATCSQIAAALGQGATRNAVIGKSIRLNLPARAVRFAQANNGRSRAARERQAHQRIIRRLDPQEPRPAGDKTIAKGKAWEPLPGVVPIPLDALNAHTCRWPIGDERPYLFCGAEPKAGSSYCAAHAARSTGAGSSYERQAIGAAKAISNEELRHGAMTLAARETAGA